MQRKFRSHLSRIGATGAAVLFIALGCAATPEARGEGSPALGEAAPGELEVLRSAAHRLETPADLERVAEWAGDAPFVLLGEASHGSEEFYRLRAELTKQLVLEGGLDAILIEGDWPSAARVDRYVRGASDDASARHALGEFQRFPRWMWRNEVVVDFVEWLRRHNEGLPADEKVGFHGVDLYSAEESAAALVASLPTDAAARARARIACFVRPGADPADQVRSNLMRGDGAACERQLTTQVSELERSGASLDQLQNARTVREAERYWRAQMTGSEPSWNVRDRHMADVVEQVRAHYDAEREAPVRLAVWAHNSHLGDARATEMSRRGQLNLGQLLNERYGDENVFNVGFSTYTGEVTAVSEWDDPARKKAVNPGRPDSYEGVLHDVGIESYALDLNDPAVERALAEPRLARAIGVIYRPETERQSHYFASQLPDQFDAVIHVDTTSALRPIDGWVG